MSSSVRTFSVSIVISRIAVFFIGALIACHATEALAQETIEKTICSPGASTTFNFTDPAHLNFMVTYEVDNSSGVTISPASGITTSSQTFHVTGNQAGSFTIKVTYKCAEPGCNDGGTDYVHVTVKNNCPPPSFALPFRNDLRSMHNMWISRDVGTSWGTYIAGYVPETYAFSDDEYYYACRRENIIDRINSVYKTPPGKTITGAYSEGNKGYILFNDNTVSVSTWTPLGLTAPTFIGTLPPFNGNDNYFKISGDALYAISKNHVARSDDAGKTWNPDTTGLGATQINDIETDTLQTVFLATDKGMMSQAAASSTWNKVPSLGDTTVTVLFIDHRDRMFISTYSGLRLSTNHGVTWTRDSMGIGYDTPISFGDDAFGNVYAVTNYGARAYRSLFGTHAWERIDAPITSQSANYNSYQSVIRHIEGDTLLFAATMYGIYQSTNQGTTWSPANEHIQTSKVFGLVRQSSGKFYISTNTGINSKSPSDTAWRHVYPQNGVQSGLPLFRDDAGNVFTLGAPADPSSFSGYPLPYQSTDDGATWFADTAGYSIVKNNGLYYVDETGTQLMATYQPKFFVKRRGAPWMLDSLGDAPHTGDFPSVILSDRHGSLYVAVNNSSNTFVWKRPITGGVWTLDTAGLPSAAIFALVADRNGAIYAGVTGGGLYRESGGHWVPTQFPQGRNGTTVFAASTDSSGRIFASFSDYNMASYTPHGVYFSTDHGATWKYAGLEGISVNQLVSYGDSTYALTVSGVSVLTGEVSSAVDEGPTSSLVPRNAMIGNFPNPFSDATTLAFATLASGHVRVEIVDMYGRIVSTPVNTVLSSGGHSFSFNAASLPSGAYACRLLAPGIVSESMMVVKR